MDGFALVRFEDVVVMMPFQRPCEKELAFESTAFYAQRYGEIRLEVEQCEMRVRRRDRGCCSISMRMAGCGSTIAFTRYVPTCWKWPATARVQSHTIEWRLAGRRHS